MEYIQSMIVFSLAYDLLRLFITLESLIYAESAGPPCRTTMFLQKPRTDTPKLGSGEGLLCFVLLCFVL